MALILYVAAAPLLTIALIAILNTLVFPRLRPLAPVPPPFPPVAPAAQPPRVSVLIPARDEAATIGYTIRSLMAQTYDNFEVILLDDHSTDGTADIARRAAAGNPRLRILQGQPLLSGWLGKNWACHQLADAAQADLLVFADADVQWSAEALAALMAHLYATRADLLTIWPTQKTISWPERLIVPLMALVIMGYLPVPLVHYTPFTIFTAAMGQCMVFRRNAYRAIGGHSEVRGQIVEDIALARRIKQRGLRLRMADGAGLIKCRMYRDWPSVRDGFAKNIIAGYGGVAALLLATVFHWLIFILPWGWLLLGWQFPEAYGWPVVPLLLVALGVGTRALTALSTRQRVQDAVLMPISALLMTAIAAKAVYWQLRYGGPRWKGRTLAREGRVG